MKLATLLGVAAAVGVVLYFRSERGRQVWNEYRDKFSDLSEKGDEVLSEISQRVTKFGKQAKGELVPQMEG